MSDSQITLAIVEDDPALRDTLTRLIAGTPHWKISGVHGSGEEAVAALSALTPEELPDIVIMDINLPGISGIESIRQIRETHAQLPFLILTIYDSDDNVFEALSAGASGYLMKREAPGRLLTAVSEVLAGEAPMSGHIARKVVQFFHRRGETQRETEDLTRREREVLDLLATGCLYKEIAGRLGIGHETVRTHVNHVYKKLHVRTRTEAVIKYLGQQG